MNKPIAAFSLAVLAAGGLTYLNDERAEARTVRPDTLLQQQLGNKVAGSPQSCIMAREANNMRTIDERTILFRVSSNLVYRNDLVGDCPIRGTSRRLERRSPSTSLCRNESLRVIDNNSGVYYGSCGLGDFVPYRAR